MKEIKMMIEKIEVVKSIKAEDTNIDIDVFENVWEGWTGNDLAGLSVGVDTLEQISDYVLDIEEDMEEGLMVDEEWLVEVKKLEAAFKELNEIDEKLEIKF
jgi:hypothetical protein